MIKLTASYTSKVPGQQEYSSECASAGIELELADSEAGNVEAKLDQMWATLKAAVEDQLNRANGQRAAFEQASAQQGRPVARITSGTNNGAGFASNGNGPRSVSQPASNGQRTNSPEPATKKQIGFLLGTARRACNWSADQVKSWLQQEWGKGLNDLTKAEAAQVIDTLQAQVAA